MKNHWPALLFCMSLPSLMSWVELHIVLPHGDPPAILKVAFPAGKVIQFTFPLVYVLLRQRDRIRLSWPDGRGLLPAVLLALAVAAAMFVLYFGLLRQTDVFADTRGKIGAWLTKLNVPGAGGFFVMAIAISIPHSLLEEYYWRWFVFGFLRDKMPWPAAALLSGLAFMSHHVLVLSYFLPGYFWTAVMPFSLGVAIGGVAWAWLYERYGNLYAPWVSHLLVDAAIMVVGYDLIFR